MGKKILYIWDADYPWDVRVEKICESLRKNGHDVHIAARNLKRLPGYEKISGLHIHRLMTWRNDRINYALSFPVFFSPIWKNFLDDIIKKNNIDLVIVRDLPMAIAGIWAGKWNNIPVIFDMAEDYVSMIWDIWRARKFQGLNLIVRNPYLAKLVERYVFKKADHILVVVDEARDLVLSRGGNPKKITIVGNTPPVEFFNNSRVQMNEDLKKIEENFSVIYTGGVQMGRGIKVVIDAMPELVKEIPNFLFVVVGDGYATEQLKEMVLNRHLQDYVLWVGWVDHGKVFDYIRLSKIGVIPHFVTDHVNTTIPNKIFDYMGLGLPVISSDAVPTRRILATEGCGITFENGNAKDLARAILELYSGTDDYGKNGRAAIKYKYNWEADEKRLLNVIHMLT